MRSRVDRHDRETFITALCAAVPTATRAHALRLLRWGRTYGRLAEAQCNGDWPYAPSATGSFAHSRHMLKCVKCHQETNWYAWGRNGTGDCPSCRAERIIRETCEGMGRPLCICGEFWPCSIHGRAGGYRAAHSYNAPVPHFGGDPRGHTVRLAITGAPLDAYERPALAVPTS